MTLAGIITKIEGFEKSAMADIAKLLPIGNKVIKALQTVEADFISVAGNPLFETFFAAVFPALAPEVQEVFTWLATNQTKINSDLNLGIEITTAGQTPAQIAAAILAALPKATGGTAAALEQIASMIVADVTNGTLTSAEATALVQSLKSIL